MSWLLENWFGSSESLEDVKDEIQNHLHRESYIGISGIENPEQSATRIPAKELSLMLVGPWGQNLDDAESELMQLIHDEMPSVVRDEFGILPFFTNVLKEGYLVLSFIRNASNREMLLNKLPLALVTMDGTIVATKTFDMLQFGPVADMSSRPCEFMFRWSEFNFIPEEEVPLSLVFLPRQKKGQRSAEQLQQASSLTADEQEKYEQLAMTEHPVKDGQVKLRVLEIMPGEEGGLKIIVLFSNGLDKRLEFTEVPIHVRDRQGNEVASMHYGMKNLRVDAMSTRIWAFYVPVESLKTTEFAPEDLTASIPEAKPEKELLDDEPKGLIQ
ncbi:SLAP domain-containing protein [Brevibacillus fluminis]|uniref:SLAP domain-containing protein n=1 Tax=Brevibacillus fluminis TaxID=511487 RepID=UPI003F8A8209